MRPGVRGSNSFLANPLIPALGVTSVADLTVSGAGSPLTLVGLGQSEG